MQTPLYYVHKHLKAKFTNFAGWTMPLQYTSIIEEVRAVREEPECLTSPTWADY